MKTENRTIRLAIGGTDYTATLADTDAARLLAERLPMRLSMTELNGNEKYANLDKPLPTKTENVRRIEAGDVMLWGDNCLVVFYKSFDTPYSYTRIGRISDAKGLAKSLGNGGILQLHAFVTDWRDGENGPFQRKGRFGCQHGHGLRLHASI